VFLNSETSFGPHRFRPSGSEFAAHAFVLLRPGMGAGQFNGVESVFFEPLCHYVTITMLCCAVLCCAVLCYAVLCYATLCCAMLCYAMTVESLV
jgi:hypothetical protein